ncbi:hypothetical protein ACN23B_07345 [Anabaena sp. FACHB-709]|uniref:Uncharacterized protein n=2 Tax=Nostocaceae TaxID=1162 RepID=A0A1Z4KU62_ANAVA|nr:MULTISPECIES: hypothetical protein [Nostocaceae]BAY72447.1 hypothetical protein NIES23_52720 [Trichormus variabilis NIES-23]HBW29519.1 hypothetical protein [Nostoc sp. UBA8866]MBD2170828.1 hypothetical protein [Anabaena cylindrica FACHB-318]MBD2262613.1 hypothetical protein [Anabaena sp. FACHB-709]MBD2272160.1 hypothetical protein [Nostoc sp. PCC 7120 = FACHB-418]
MANINYFITDEHLQIAHKIAKFLNNEQKRIEPGKEGISTELSKLITYLDAKIKQNSYVDKTLRKPSRFFTYIEQLVEHGKTIGHSKKTTTYYESINEVCNQYLKSYEKKPLVIIQILGWSQRLMRYYKTVDDDDDTDISPGISTEVVVRKIPKVIETPKIVKPQKTEDIKTLESPQSLKPTKPIPPKLIEPKKSEDSKNLQRPRIPDSPKPIKNSQPEAPKPVEPPKPWERVPKKPSK